MKEIKKLLAEWARSRQNWDSREERW